VSQLKWICLFKKNRFFIAFFAKTEELLISEKVMISFFAQKKSRRTLPQ